MKNWKILLNAALVGVCFIYLTGCDGGEEEVTPDAPSITVTSTNPADDEGDNLIEVMSGEDVQFVFNVNAPGGFNVARIKFDGTTVIEQNRNDLGLEAGETNVENLSFTILDLTTSGTATLEAVDDLGQTTTVDYTITVTEPQLNAFQAILLEAPTGNETSQSFFSTNTGETYSVEDVNTGEAGTSANIDFGYYYGATEHATLASPSNYLESVYDLEAEGWNSLNTTSIKATGMTQSQFNEFTSASDLEIIFEEGTEGGNRKTNLEVGDVLVFQTDVDKEGGAKYGLIYVSEIDPGTESDKSITLEILVEK